MNAFRFLIVKHPLLFGSINHLKSAQPSVEENEIVILLVTIFLLLFRLYGVMTNSNRCFYTLYFNKTLLRCKYSLLLILSGYKVNTSPVNLT